MDDEQGGAGGVPPHDGHSTRRPQRRPPHQGDDERTPAADTDEASRLDRPKRDRDPRTGQGKVRWTAPKHDRNRESSGES